jgi:1-acyl-sn-glycerol-3-phosphate acyltransferase
MDGLWWVLRLAAAWLAVVLLFRLAVLPVMRRGPGRDPVTVALWVAARVLCRLVHRARYEGQEALRRQIDPGRLIVVSNHTGSIDPFLIQSACRFKIRWMMARDQMWPVLGDIWRHLDFIPVARDGTDLGPARQAIRHAQAGGVVGIFPEGGIVRSRGEIWPFYAGVGLVVARTRAPVLLVWVRGTPDTSSITGSLFSPSHAEVTFVELMSFKGQRDAVAITEALRQRMQEISGWPLNDDPPPPAEEQPDEAAM